MSGLREIASFKQKPETYETLGRAISMWKLTTHKDSQPYELPLSKLHAPEWPQIFSKMLRCAMHLLWVCPYFISKLSRCPVWCRMMLRNHYASALLAISTLINQKLRIFKFKLRQSKSLNLCHLLRSVSILQPQPPSSNVFFMAFILPSVEDFA